MRTTVSAPHQTERGYVFISFMLVLAGISLVSLGGAMSWTSSSSQLTDRSIQHYNAVAAAEAATEKAITYMFRDFRTHAILTNLNVYRTNVPNTPELTSRFQFLDASSNLNQVTVLPYYPHANTNTATNEMEYGYRIVANARSTEYSQGSVPAAVQQLVTFSNDPIFRYAIYYSLNLEINPSPNMTIIGKVHSQKDLYYSPANTLTFKDSVTVVGRIYNTRDPNDGMGNQGGTTVYPAAPKVFMSGAPSKTLPVGTNNSPEAVHAIVEVPPVGEDIHSEIGGQRYYNNVDVILTVTDSNMVARTGPKLVSSASVSNGPLTSFVSTNADFFNGRENKTVNTTDINIGGLNTWINDSGNPIKSVIASERNHLVNSIYVQDLRTRPGGKGNGVRVTNGRYLPADGLTLATAAPIYVKGHYNAPNLATTNTINAEPASLVGDAITVLSESWNDANNTSVANWYKDASATTVNAAFLAGIVPTFLRSGQTGYSGGVENFPRFLEKWGSSRAFTYNGSMVVMFPSQYATNTWKRSDGKTYYDPPARDWAFDVNYLKPSGLPPCTPQLRTLVRDRMEIVRPFSLD